MTRTTIMLPTSLQLAVKRRARELNISMGQLIRSALESTLAKGKSADRFTDDPFLSDWAKYTGEVPSDGSLKHDDYLY